MLAGDRALGWALEQDDVAVFWKDQLPPDAEIRLPQDRLQLSFEYHIAPRVEPVGEINFSAANTLLDRVRQIEKSNEVPSWTREVLHSDYRRSLFKREQAYVPGSISYRSQIAEIVTSETMQLVHAGIEAPTVELFDSSARQAVRKIPLYLTKQFYVHPEPALAYFYAQKRYNGSQTFDTKGRVIDPINNKKHLSNIRQLVDLKVQAGPMERAYTTGLALGYDPRDLDLNHGHGAPDDIKDLS